MVEVHGIRTLAPVFAIGKIYIQFLLLHPGFSMGKVEFLKQCYRTLMLTRKPTNEEFKRVAKITGAGIIIVGLIGFLVRVISQMLSG